MPRAARIAIRDGNVCLAFLFKMREYSGILCRGTRLGHTYFMIVLTMRTK
jgi:hypothetical protein